MQEKLIRIAKNSVALREKCVGNHFVATVVGDGSDSLSVEIPFEPDAVVVICSDPRIMSEENKVAIINMDIASLGLLGGEYQITQNGGLYNTAMTSNTVLSRYSWADGIMTMKNITFNGVTCTFCQGLPYNVVAVKYTDKTLRQRYTEFVESLEGSGTAQVCKNKVYAAFSDGEWSALKATRPDWSFVEV